MTLLNEQLQRFQCQQFLRRVINKLSLSPWLSGLILFLSHNTCWALLAEDLRWPGFKSGSGRKFSVGWTNGRYAMRFISRTGTQVPVSFLNCDRCRLWSYDITAGYKCEYYYYYIRAALKTHFSPSIRTCGALGASCVTALYKCTITYFTLSQTVWKCLLLMIWE